MDPNIFVSTAILLVEDVVRALSTMEQKGPNCRMFGEKIDDLQVQIRLFAALKIDDIEDIEMPFESLNGWLSSIKVFLQTRPVPSSDRTSSDLFDLTFVELTDRANMHVEEIHCIVAQSALISENVSIPVATALQLDEEEELEQHVTEDNVSVQSEDQHRPPPLSIVTILFLLFYWLVIALVAIAFALLRRPDIRISTALTPGGWIQRTFYPSAGPTLVPVAQPSTSGLPTVEPSTLHSTVRDAAKDQRSEEGQAVYFTIMHWDNCQSFSDHGCSLPEYLRNLKTSAPMDFNGGESAIRRMLTKPGGCDALLRSVQGLRAPGAEGDGISNSRTSRTSRGERAEVKIAFSGAMSGGSPIGTGKGTVDRGACKKAVGELVQALQEGSSREASELITSILFYLGHAKKCKTAMIEADVASMMMPLVRDEGGFGLGKTAALGLLSMLAVDRQGNVNPFLAPTAVVPLLLPLLEDASKDVAKFAVTALVNLAAADPRIRTVVCAVEGRGVERVVRALRTGHDEEMKEIAAIALRNLVGHDDCVAQMADWEVIPPLLRLLREGSEKAKEAAVYLFTHLSLIPSQKKHLQGTEAILLLVQALETGTSFAKTSAAKTLLDVALSSDTKQAIFNAGALLPLLQLLETGSPMGQENAADALSALATDPGNVEVIAATTGAIPRLVTQLTQGFDVVKVSVVQVFHSLAKHDEVVKSAAVRRAIPPLLTLLRSDSFRVQDMSIGALGSLSRNRRNRKKIAATTGSISLLTSFLTDATDRFQRQEAARVLYSIAQEAEFRPSIAAAAAIPLLVRCLHADVEMIKEFAAGVLLHLAEDAILRRAIGAAGAVPALLDMTQESVLLSTRAVASGALANLALEPDLRRRIVQDGRTSIVTHHQAL